MRNVLAYDLAREIIGPGAGMRTRFVELFYNPGTGGLSMEHYAGVYVLIERIARSPARVDVEKLNQYVGADSETITGGYIIKRDDVPTGRTFRTPDGKRRYEFVYPEDPNEAQISYLSNYLGAFEETLAGPSFADPTSGYRKYIDVDSFIQNHLLVEVLKNTDGLRRSYYFTKTRSGPIRSQPIWDYNLSLGNSAERMGYLPKGWQHKTLRRDEYFWYGRLFEDPSFEKQYRNEFQKLQKTSLSKASLIERIESYASLLEEPQARNFKKWPILGKYVLGNPPGFKDRKTYQDELDFMARWLRLRLDWIDSELNAN
jgi:hypothetical protein